MAYDLQADLASAKAQTTAIYGDQYAPQTTINPQPTNPSAGQPVVIQPAQTTGATPLTIPQPANTTTQADSTVAGAGQTSKTIQDYLAQLETPTTALDGQNQALMDRLSSLYGSNTGKAQETAKLEDTTGLNTLKKQLADINSQILTQSAQYDKAFAQAETQSGMLSSIVMGQQGAIRRSQAADIGLLQARAMGLQGQVGAAQDAIERAINLKYQGIEEEITAKEKQMALIAPLLTAQQAKQAKAQELLLADEKERIAEEKQKAKNNLSFAFEQGVSSKFANNGGEIFNTQTGDGFKTPEEFFKAAGVKSFEEAYARGMITDIDYERIAEKGMIKDWINKYPDANISYTDSLEVARKKVVGSYTYQKTIKSTGRSGSGGGSSRGVTNGGSTSSGNISISPVPKTASENNIRNWLASNWHKLASKSAYYDVWGVAADALRAAGIDPAKYDKTFWDVFRPSEYEANHPKETKKSATTTSGDDIATRLEKMKNSNPPK